MSHLWCCNCFLMCVYIYYFIRQLVPSFNLRSYPRSLLLCSIQFHYPKGIFVVAEDNVPMGIGIDMLVAIYHTSHITHHGNIIISVIVTYNSLTRFLSKRKGKALGEFSLLASKILSFRVTNNNQGKHPRFSSWVLGGLD